ncbi:MAG TPA: YggS family pyridoxal phosphate-dependent enzyme, partial [Solirubrobacteraceae bacterium]|nr:YggS family pyridoxal phosphate-dependent enzyme [Solirubrobacteraceae bacterium]
AGEPGKSGIAPAQLDDVIARCPLPVVGLRTMPPLAARPQDSRPHFAALAALAAERGLPELSMGTTQDYAVAVEEGATVVRLGSVLLR